MSLLETKKDKEAISKAIFITFDIASAFGFFSQVKKVYNLDIEQLGIEYKKYSGILHSYYQSVFDTLSASTNKSTLQDRDELLHLPSPSRPPPVTVSPLYYLYHLHLFLKLLVAFSVHPYPSQLSQVSQP